MMPLLNGLRKQASYGTCSERLTQSVATVIDRSYAVAVAGG
jgi:hypothetical protein